MYEIEVGVGRFTSVFSIVALIGCFVMFILFIYLDDFMPLLKFISIFGTILAMILSIIIRVRLTPVFLSLFSNMFKFIFLFALNSMVADIITTITMAPFPILLFTFS